MPKLSEERQRERRRHVLESAWRCFSRDGFHATSMDDVIAETGWSSSAVYRYARSKEELISAAAEESLALFDSVVTDLLSRKPIPTPRESVEAFVSALESESKRRSYDVGALVIQTWAESLRNERIAERARGSYDLGQRRLSRLTRAWRDAGHLPPSLSAADLAAALVLLVPGLTLDRSVLDRSATRGLMSALDLWAPGATR